MDSVTYPCISKYPDKPCFISAPSSIRSSMTSSEVHTEQRLSPQQTICAPLCGKEGYGSRTPYLASTSPVVLGPQLVKFLKQGQRRPTPRSALTQHQRQQHRTRSAQAVLASRAFLYIVFWADLETQ